MNKMPLPLHLLSAIPGYAMLGQTSFGGYFKVITAWWQNDCPDVFENASEFQSLSGMYERDYAKYRPKIEPLLLRSLEILKEYRTKKKAASAHTMLNLAKAHTVMRNKKAERQSAGKTKGNIVDRNTPVNPTPIKPPPQEFHKGWNLEKAKSPNINRTTTVRPTLLDK